MVDGPSYLIRTPVPEFTGRLTCVGLHVSPPPSRPSPVDKHCYLLLSTLPTRVVPVGWRQGACTSCWWSVCHDAWRLRRSTLIQTWTPSPPIPHTPTHRRRVTRGMPPGGIPWHYCLQAPSGGPFHKLPCRLNPVGNSSDLCSTGRGRA